MVAHDLEKYFVMFDHAQLAAGALFDGFGALFEVAHFGIERCVAHLGLLVDFLLRVDLPVYVPHFQPTAFAQP